VVADAKALADLRVAWPKAIGIEMESLGVAMAAYQSRAGFLMVKAASDFADRVKDDSWQRYAAEAAARFAVAVLAGARRPAKARPIGEHRAIVIGQVDGDVPRWPGAPLMADGRSAVISPGSGQRLAVGSGTGGQGLTAGGQGFPVIVRAEPVELLSDVEILVVPQNVFLEVPQHFKMSVSAAVGRASVRRGDSGEITADVVGDELRDWLRRHSRPGLPVAPGTVIITSTGEMAGNRIRRLYHAAIAVPRPGTNDYHIEPSAIVEAVGNVLTAARRERAEFDPPLRSIGFPLLGAGRGGLEPTTSVSWLWAALEREWRGDPEWEIHFIARDRAMADLVLGALLEAGAAPQLARPTIRQQGTS
jgi:O-acetyl-ADP-ribose deacetylase (regulator of RNase III)